MTKQDQSQGMSMGIQSDKTGKVILVEKGKTCGYQKSNISLNYKNIVCGG